jgi:nucleoid-associated protein YgaU
VRLVGFERDSDVDRRKKIIIAGIVVAVGVVLALQYRKIEQAKTQPTAGSTWHDSAQASTQPSAQPGASDSVTSQSSPHAGATAFDGRIEAAPGSSTSQTDSGTTSDVASSAPHGDLSPTGSASSTGSSSSQATGPLVDANAPEQTHKVVDGDTLQNLAQHYLGRANRYLELYEYNRDILKNPEVLPIGAELRIPSQVALPSTGNAPVQAPAPSTLIAPLVPVSTVPVSTSPAPNGKGALPVAQHSGPRTYTVQVGDNLIDLARKFYGDGRQAQTLYQANRNVMRTPNDLRPGMVLAVP